MSIAVMVLACLIVIWSIANIIQSFRRKAESIERHGRLPGDVLKRSRKGIVAGIAGVVVGVLVLGGGVLAYSNQAAKAPITAGEVAKQKAAEVTTPSDATPQETEEEKAAREAKEKEEQEKKEQEAVNQAAADLAANDKEITGDDDNYVGSTVSEEQWELLFGKMDAYLRYDSLSSALPIRNALCDFSHPVGLPFVSDYEWIEARFFGIAREDSSEEIKQLAQQGEKLNLLDDEELSVAIEELEAELETWRAEFDALPKDKQAIRAKLNVCQLIMRNPVWAEQFLQFVERHDYFTIHHDEELKAAREYLDTILHPKDENGKDIPLEEAQKMGLGWEQVYEYVDGHAGERAYRQTTKEYRQVVGTPLCKIILDSRYVGVTDKALYRNWELDPAQLDSFLVTKLTKVIDPLESFQFDWVAKDGKTVNVSMGVNARDSRIGEFGAARQSKITKDDDDYVPPKPSGGGGGGGTTTTLDKDPARGAGPSGNAQDFAGDNVEGNSNPGVMDSRPPAEKKAQEAEAAKKAEETKNEELKQEVSDDQGGQTHGGTPPETKGATDDSKASTGVDAGSGQQGNSGEDNSTVKVVAPN